VHELGSLWSHRGEAGTLGQRFTSSLGDGGGSDESYPTANEGFIALAEMSAG